MKRLTIWLKKSYGLNLDYWAYMLDMPLLTNIILFTDSKQKGLQFVKAGVYRYRVLIDD
jgi:hypothetical protein